MSRYSLMELAANGTARPGPTYSNFQRACQAATVRASGLSQQPATAAAEVVVVNEAGDTVRRVPVVCRRERSVAR